MFRPATSLYSIYILNTPITTGVYVGLFADDNCIHAADRKEG
jgi:hypothetical protein